MEIKINDLIFGIYLTVFVVWTACSVGQPIPTPEVGQTYGLLLPVNMGLIIITAWILGRTTNTD